MDRDEPTLWRAHWRGGPFAQPVRSIRPSAGAGAARLDPRAAIGRTEIGSADSVSPRGAVANEDRWDRRSPPRRKSPGGRVRAGLASVGVTTQPLKR